VLALAEGTTIVIDGATGELIVDPPAATLSRFRQRAAEMAAAERKHRAAAGELAFTLDGTRIEVAANLGSRADARAAADEGADSAGLVRTEFLFLNRDHAPNLDEQVAEYLAIAVAMGGRRVTFRTLDVGGDKPLSYLPMAPEANPFLGHRGIRLSLERRDLLLDQLAAICHVARQGPTSVMFPMVTTVAELRDARGLLEEAAGPAGLPDGLRVGMMVEVPAAAMKIATFLPHLDFVSIGTNDLAQYTLAAERGNPSVATLSDPMDPGVLSLIQHVCHVAAGRVPVAVCGEAAADDTAIPILLGLGVREEGDLAGVRRGPENVDEPHLRIDRPEPLQALLDRRVGRARQIRPRGRERTQFARLEGHCAPLRIVDQVGQHPVAGARIARVGRPSAQQRDQRPQQGNMQLAQVYEHGAVTLGPE